MKKRPARRTSKKKTPKKMRGNRKLPYVAVATICENVLHEEKIASLIRIIDTYNISAEQRTLPPGVLSFVIYVLLKSGEAIGKRRIQFVGTLPSGEQTFKVVREVEFMGEEAGVAVECPVKLTIKDVGVYWFDVKVNNETVSRIPLRINYSPTARKKG